MSGGGSIAEGELGVVGEVVRFRTWPSSKPR